MNQENAAALEPDNQIFAAALDALDSLALEAPFDIGGVERPYEPAVEDAYTLEPPTAQ